MFQNLVEEMNLLRFQKKTEVVVGVGKPYTNNFEVNIVVVVYIAVVDLFVREQ